MTEKRKFFLAWVGMWALAIGLTGLLWLLLSQAGTAHVRPACRTWIATPLVVTCTNGHGYVRQNGRWIDLGTGSPGGLMPRG